MADDSILIQVQLGSPTRANINAVTKQIRSALSNVSANVQIQNGRQATKTLQDIKSKTDAATKSTTSFAEAIGLSGRRFVAFTSAVAVVGRLTSALSQATREAIKFEREFVKLAQVFDTDVRALGNLQNSLSDLSREFGLSATVIAKTSVVLAQSGLTAKQTEEAMRTLAKTTLAATFDSIAASTEGAVAIMAQFGTEATKLEAQLGAINAVSKKFAVESGDIIEAVRRSGGAFRAAGGTLNEFIALFTSVRSTTRESAETIATGFRTIFARLQRPKTIEFFRELNIELTDGKGNFIGAFEAVRRLSKGLEEAGIKAGSIKFAGVVEQLGGIRQVSRVIPLLQQFTKAELARQVAIGGAGSLDKDAAKAQATLAQSFARTTENFRALIREISQTGTFQAIVKIALDLANAFIEVARSLKPLIPLIAAFGAIKFGGLLSGAVRSGVGGAGGTGGLGKGFNKGGKVLGFNRGGTVPGTGNGDTVPAMLEPGEFVIRKSAVNAFGADRLSKINKHAKGGPINTVNNHGQNLKPLYDVKRRVKNKTGIANKKGKVTKTITVDDTYTGKVKIIGLEDKTGRDLSYEEVRGDGTEITDRAINHYKNFKLKGSKKKPSAKARLNATNAFLQEDDQLGQFALNFKQKTGGKNIFKEGRTTNLVNLITGAYGEKIYSESLKKNGFTAGKLKPSQGVDFVASKGGPRRANNILTEVKVTQDKVKDEFIIAKALKFLGLEAKGAGKPKRNRKEENTPLGKLYHARAPQKLATGGAVGTDTVPALLTPGEFVINKESAKSFGYGKLGKINKYAKGGVVQKFAGGGDVGEGGGGFGKLAAVLFVLPQLLSTFAESIGGANSEIGKFLKAFGNAFLTITIIAAGIKQFKKGLSDFIGSIGKKARIVKATDEASKEIRAGGDKASSSIREAGEKVEKSLEEVSKLAKAFESARQRISETGATKTAAKKEETKLRGNLTRAKKDAVPGASNKFIREAEEALAKAVTKRVKIEKDILRKQKLNAAKKDVLATTEFTNQEDLNKEIKRRADAQKFVAENIKQSEPEGTPKAKGGFGRRARGVVQGARRKFRGTKVGRTVDVAARKGQAGLNKLKAGKIGKVLGKLPAALGVVMKGLYALNVAALAVTAGFVASFKVAGEKATKASEEAIQDGKVQDAQLQALRASSAEKAAKDLTVASGLVQGFLGPFAGIAQPFLVVASATGALGEAIDAGTRVFNDFIKGIVNVLDTLGLVDPEIKQQIFEGLIDPQVKRELDAFSAGLKAATRNLEKQGEQIKEDIELSKNRLANIRDQGDREKELAGTFEKISNRVAETRTERQVDTGRGTTSEFAVGPKAAELFEKILKEASPERKKKAKDFAASNADAKKRDDQLRKRGAFLSPSPQIKIPKTRDVAPAAQEVLKRQLEEVEENTKNLKGVNDEQLTYLGFLKQQSQSVQELSRVLGLASSESLKFVKTKKGEVLLSFETIEASKPLSKLYNSLVIELGNEEDARSKLSAVMSDETKLREANNATLAAQQKAFSNLLQKFTFGSDESRQEIGQDINSVKKLVAADFNIDSPQIASEERSKILSFLQSVPGATFQGKDGKVVQSEDIVLESILKKFEKFGLDQTVLSDPDDVKQRTEEKRKEAREGLTGLAKRRPLSPEEEKRILTEAQREVAKETLSEQLYPQKAQLDELKAQTKLLEELRNQAKGETGDRTILRPEDEALAQKNADARIKREESKQVSAILSNDPKLSKQVSQMESGETPFSLSGALDIGRQARKKIPGISPERRAEILEEERNELRITPEEDKRRELENRRKEEFGDVEAETEKFISKENAKLDAMLAIETQQLRQLNEINNNLKGTGNVGIVHFSPEQANKQIELIFTPLKAAVEGLKFLWDLSSGGVQKKSKGGPIYASQGTLVNMQPQGTDTVPAMLTPGEFVINAQSASRLGLDTLNELNGYAKGGPVKYLGRGGGSTEDEEERLRARQARQSDFSDRVREVEGDMETNAYLARRKNNTLGDSRFNTPLARKLFASRARKKAARESFKERQQTRAAEERARNLEAAREQNRERLAARRERSADSIGETVQRKGLSYAHTPAGIQRSTNFYNKSPNQPPPVMSEQMRRDLQGSELETPQMIDYRTRPIPGVSRLSDQTPLNTSVPTLNNSNIPLEAMPPQKDKNPYQTRIRPTAPTPTPTPPPIDPDKNRFNRGGLVRGPQYLSRGGAAAGGGGGIDTSGLASFASDFGSSVSDLVGSAVTLEVAPMGININLNGAELLAQLPQMVQQMVIGEIQSELGRFEQTRDFNNTPGAYASSILA